MLKKLFGKKEATPAEAFAAEAMAAEGAEASGATSIAEVEFVSRVRDAAGYLESAYWKAKQVSREWYSRPELALDIPFDNGAIEDGNTGKPLTHMDVYGVLNRMDELIADYEANSYAKLNTVIRASSVPAE